MASSSAGSSNGYSIGTSNGTSVPSRNGRVSSNWPRKLSNQELDETFAQLATVIQASNRPYRPDGELDMRDEATGYLTDLNVLRKGGFLAESIKTLWMLFRGYGKPIDDKTMIMERVIQLTARLPPTSKLRVALTTHQVGQLWESLQHPPLSYLGDEFIYRQADGGYNSILEPSLGRAGSPYARSVKPMTKMPGAPPDAFTLFDAIFSRGPNGENYRPSDNNISSMLFYTASIIIHDLFRTNRADPNISDTSSYLDLSPLYGNNKEEQASVRTFKDGMLKKDAWSEKRLLAFPPGVSVFLIMFNRFHNYVAEQLKAINEGGRFSLKYERTWADLDEETKARKALEVQDENLFQTARLVTCGLYINFILNDYLRTIVNLNRTDTTWTLDPRFDPTKAYSPDETPAGIGNMVSVEFNLIYRWHSCISERDDKWTQELYQQIFPNKDTSKLTLMEFGHGVRDWEASIPQDPAERVIGGLQRQPDGSFNDDGLVKILRESIEDRAGAFGVRNVPEVLKLIEVLGIEQTRKWKVASLNEFREFFGLKRHETFEDINSDPDVANTLRQLYGHPDYVEMYAGLVAEDDKKPMVPGVGIGPTYTISRAILSDAVTLVRSDRFYTVDYTAGALTNWGFQEASVNSKLNQGCVGYKLFLRAFPNHFKHNSIYACFPLTIPSENKKIHENLGTAAHYNWDPPSRQPAVIQVTSDSARKQILAHDSTLQSTLGPGEALIKDFIASRLTSSNLNSDIRRLYRETTEHLLRQHAYRITGTNCFQVDAVRDVLTLVPTYFTASLLNLPLKSSGAAHELYTQLFSISAARDPTLDQTLAQPVNLAADAAIRQLAPEIKVSLATPSLSQKLWDTRNTSALSRYGVDLLQHITANGETIESALLPVLATATAAQTTLFAEVLDYYLTPSSVPRLQEIQKLSCAPPTPETSRALKHYALEGAKAAATGMTYRTAVTPTILSDGTVTLELECGDRVAVPAVGELGGVFCWDFLNGGWGEMVGEVAGEVLGVVGRLDGLRRAPGGWGELKCVEREGRRWYLKEDWSGYVTVPGSMKIRWDEWTESVGNEVGSGNVVSNGKGMRDGNWVPT